MNTMDSKQLMEVFIQASNDDLEALFNDYGLHKPTTDNKVESPNGIMIYIIAHISPVKEIRYREYCYKCKIDHTEKKLGVLTLISNDSNKTLRIASWVHEAKT